MFKTIKETIKGAFLFTLNDNQSRDIERLVFEIMRREGISFDEIIKKCSGEKNFIGLKKALIKRRFPITSTHEDIELKSVFLNKLSKPINFPPSSFPLPRGERVYIGSNNFCPSEIIIEKAAKNSELANKITAFFPKTPVEEIISCKDYNKKHPFSVSHLKEPIIFIVKEKQDFLKPCPCTKGHVSCGYWILNLGFGCPFDCSYCFLQQYSNFPGIMLPANIEDFFEQFDKLHKKLKKPLRIGTGEFCDSLALDHITGYSEKLIDYFKDKNVLFELKTKSDNIKNLLSPHPDPLPPFDFAQGWQGERKFFNSENIRKTPQNVVVAWSLNPNCIIEKEEIGAASLEERLRAASQLQQRGYNLAFHFDPVIFTEQWENLYRELINTLYKNLKPPFSWISLGTLRSHRGLKGIVEQRFPQSDIFYGELLIGKDQKLRYPEFLRKEIYSKMMGFIRKFDTKSPIYLCMDSLTIAKRQALSSIFIASTGHS